MPKLNQDDTDNPNSPIAIKEIEFEIPKRNLQARMILLEIFTKYLKN